MGDNNGVPASFNLNPKGAGTLKLQSVVQERLLSFMEADYTDKVLAEYIVVLVAHGKTQSQAAGELEAFLGPERSNSFTKWCAVSGLPKCCRLPKCCCTVAIANKGSTICESCARVALCPSTWTWLSSSAFCLLYLL